MRKNKTINILEALTILSLLEGSEGMKLDDAVQVLGLSLPTIKRNIRILRECGVEITWSRKDMAYLVGSWGIFDRAAARRLLDHSVSSAA